MRTAISLALALLMLAACGIKRPLIPPKDIPAYEAKRAKKMQQFEKDQRSAPEGGVPDGSTE